MGVDGGGDMSHPDLSNVDASLDGPATPPGPGCFALLGGASPAKAPARSKNLATAFLMCASNTCGDPTIMDGGSSLPCAQAGDGGSATTACNNCFSNVQVNSQITFTNMAGMPIMCVNIDTGAADMNGLGCTNGMGACGSQIVACVLDCNSDKDCAGLTHSDGSKSTCDLTMNQCN
jgi:hypothetical protein